MASLVGKFESGDVVRREAGSATRCGLRKLHLGVE